MPQLRYEKGETMAFVPMKTLIDRASKEGFAVPGFCVWSAEVIRLVLETAQTMRAPVVLMSGPGEFPLLSPALLAGIGREIHKRFDTPAAFHLDHGDSMETVQACIDAGYTSVMLDFSAKPFDENARALREVVTRARLSSITVEGELGTIGREDGISTEGNKASVFTDPAEAAAYVKTTGIDAIAVSIGNVHGNYRGEPKLDFALLEKIRTVVDVPIVLHGGTGIPEKDIRTGISLGIAKVNVATDLVQTMRISLMRQWAEKQNLWVPAAIAVAVETMREVVVKWIRITGAEGKAELFK